MTCEKAVGNDHAALGPLYGSPLRFVTACDRHDANDEHRFDRPVLDKRGNPLVGRSGATTHM